MFSNCMAVKNFPLVTSLYCLLAFIFKDDISKLQTEQSEKCTFQQNMSKASEIYEILLQHETILSSEVWKISLKLGL